MFGVEFIAQERQQEYQRQAAQQRLAHQAQAGRDGSLRVVARLLGGQLVRVGRSMQGQKSTPRPAASLRAIQHHL